MSGVRRAPSAHGERRALRDVALRDVALRPHRARGGRAAVWEPRGDGGEQRLDGLRHRADGHHPHARQQVEVDVRRGEEGRERVLRPLLARLPAHAEHLRPRSARARQRRRGMRA